MTAKLDGQPANIELDQANIVRQPHAQLEFTYRITCISTETPKKFRLEDNNFRDVPGYHLMAVKSRGNVDVLQEGSGSETMLARMQRALPENGAADTDLPTIHQIEAYFATPATYSAKTPPEETSRSAGPPNDSSPKSENGGRDERSRSLASAKLVLPPQSRPTPVVGEKPCPHTASTNSGAHWSWLAVILVLLAGVVATLLAFRNPTTTG